MVQFLTTKISIMKAVYIHGFAGSIHSDTITNFRKYYPELEWCPLEVDHRVDDSVKKINDFIKANADVKYLIGSSLGGFYVLCADFAGRHDRAGHHGGCIQRRTERLHFPDLYRYFRQEQHQRLLRWRYLYRRGDFL